MKKNLFILLLISTACICTAQENFNIEIVANVSHDERANDVWGYVSEDGTEYAIMGSLTRTSIWSLEDPTNPILRATFDGPSSIWRDIKSYEDHLYVSAEREKEGLLVIDMSQAPEIITSSNYLPAIQLGVESDTLHTIHNIFIDEEEGICYLAGSNVGNGGVLFFDLKTDKKTPDYIGIQDFDYAHDVFVKNDKMYTSDINSGVFSIYNIENKTTPIFLGSQQTANNFSHNAWLSDDEKILFTTDERPDAWVEAYDVSDPTDIIFLDRYQPFETKNTGVIPHNVHYHSGFLVTSWNTDGLVVIDANKPDNLVKIASYDTELEIESGSGGLWGAFPYLPSGLVLGSDRFNGLFVFRVINNDGSEGYQRASYIEGNVTDANTNQVIPNVTIKVLSKENVESNTNATGFYATGHALEGEFEVEFIKESYDTLKTTALFESGEVVVLDAALLSTVNTKEIIDLDFSIYPNPASDFIEISINNISSKRARLHIYASGGNEAYTGDLLNKKQTFNISELASGIYHARIESENGYSKTIRFIKK